MIDTTSIGYSIFYTYGFIQEKRFAAWRAEPAPEDNRTLSLENYKLRKRVEYLENELKKAKEKK